MALSLVPQYSHSYGNQLLVIEVPGELVTDLYGLSTCTLIATAPMNRLDLVPGLFTPHPIWTYLTVERQRVTIKDARLNIALDYAGVPGSTQPIYELVAGVGEEPIETHPRFIYFAGRPSAPLNGAWFIDPNSGQQSDNDDTAIFSHFTLLVDGALNPKAGISAYLDFSQACWRQRYYSTAYPNDAAYLGSIQWPPGAPSLGASRNWIYQGLTFEQRGIVYGITREWKASGFRGWDPDIYGGGIIG